MTDNKEKEIALNDFRGLAVPKENDIRIPNKQTDPEVRLDIEIQQENHLMLKIGRYLVKDISFMTYSDMYRSCCNNRSPYFSLYVSEDFKVWHLSPVLADDFFQLRYSFPLRSLNGDYSILEIENDIFVKQLKNKFSIKTPFLLENVRCAPRGKYIDNKHYLMSIKFYDSLMEQSNE